MTKEHLKVGIDAMSFDIPKIYLPIKDLAVARNIEPAKLEKGLGLLRMAFPDVHQDVVVFAANALLKLIQQENLSPKDINRIYVATESGVDSSKPIGSYLLSILEDKFGDGSFEHCDTADMTFACIGGVDALHNSLDFVRVNPDKKAIVISTDLAKYDLYSTGEYTQGAGAIAMLLSVNPRIITIDNHIGVSAKGVFDFFKPKRTLTKKEVTGQDGNPDWFGVLEDEISLAKDQPVFDGQYSNTCYQDRTRGAYFDLKNILGEQETLYKNWTNIIVHLPYSFQGRRMFSEIYALDSELKNTLPNDPQKYAERIKEISKSDDYKTFAAEKFAPAEAASSDIGNMYSGSIFMGLLSTLYFHHAENNEIKGGKFGFLAYGSGAKSKAFEGLIEGEWKSQIAKTQLFEIMEQAKPIEMETYHALHKKELKTPVIAPKNEYVLERIEKENPVLVGARYYKWL
ncbi:MAG: hydroxymethylglutaryl-CoA synthase [Flavobacteriaceae bacterium]|jgi:hydroxymethylglutaryl-CoA synthase|nr:hydroxymethylglutaryl-CoA synthase [Flavobacteriaceae bacterium]